LKSTVLQVSCGRFLPRSAPAFLPSSDGAQSVQGAIDLIKIRFDNLQADAASMIH
jgi:hypothetical protein